MIQRVLTKVLVLCWFFGWGFSARASDLTVKAYVDKTVIGLNQQFTLSVELSGKGANSVSNPKLPNMDSFAAYLGSGSSQNIQFINGRMSSSKTINYYFQATAVGKFQIGPVVVSYKGRSYQTQPITIEIQKNPSAPPQTPSKRNTVVKSTVPAKEDLFIRTIVNRKRVYQNEPVIVTYKIYTRVTVSSLGYSKLPGTTGFWVEEFPLPQQPQTSTEILNGKKYIVATIKKMALFPMTSGIKTIDPMVVECEVQVRKGSRDIFDGFFNDSFFGRSMRKIIQSQPVKIKVLPLPEQGKPKDFSGVVGRFTISSWADKSSVKTNEAISFKVKIAGEGNIRTLPEPKVVFPADFEKYPPKITEKINRENMTISGSKIFECVLVPRVQGSQRIKPVELSVFDPVSKVYKTLRTNEIVINVARGERNFVAAPSGLSKEEVKLLGQDIRFIKTASPSFRRIGAGVSNSFVFWIIIIFPLLSLSGALVYRRHLDRLQADVAYARGRRASRFVRKRLSRARLLLSISTQKEFYAEIGKALMGYIGDRLNIAEAGMITENVQNMLRKRGVKEEIIENYFECLKTCDLKRFSPVESDESEMRELLKKAEQAITQLEKVLSK